MTGSARRLCVCGSGLIAWLRTSTLVLLRQVLLNRTYLFILIQNVAFPRFVEGERSKSSLQSGMALRRLYLGRHLGLSM